MRKAYVMMFVNPDAAYYTLTLSVVALVESNGVTEDNGYYEFKLKYEKLFQWWHYWVAHSYIIYDAPKTLKIHRGCGIRLQTGQKYVLGCTSFSQCHFVKAYNSLTADEKKLVETQ
ncbi:hypothetical protein ANCCAN_14229 [Ancylostoma caninum]|uniref:Uncharacterized protein n=1 Tax=Ancylostoma caninum TaxID=29170 RepID=A0A368G658_ANCCA|nr:hypothetical protein ANCCAN_14229 [Ancylostoma caninum]